jgi:hypothetical protein
VPALWQVTAKHVRGSSADLEKGAAAWSAALAASTGLVVVPCLTLLHAFGMLLQVREFIDGAYQRTLTLLREKKDFVEAMAQVRSWIINYHIIRWVACRFCMCKAAAGEEVSNGHGTGGVMGQSDLLLLHVCSCCFDVALIRLSSNMKGFSVRWQCIP